MSQTPLRLDRYVILRSLVEANQEYLKHAPQASREPDCSLFLEVSTGKSDENPRQYQIGIKIKDLTSRSGPLPYRIEIEVAGVFTVDESFQHAERERIIQVNSASMLFGAAREHILMLTGRGPYGPFMLPTINLLGEISKPENRVAEQN